MIAAWGLFIFGVLGVIAEIEDKLRSETKFTEKEATYTTAYFLISLFSAQYIWG